MKPFGGKRTKSGKSKGDVQAPLAARCAAAADGGAAPARAARCARCRSRRPRVVPSRSSASGRTHLLVVRRDPLGACRRPARGAGRCARRGARGSRPASPGPRGRPLRRPGRLARRYTEADGPPGTLSAQADVRRATLTGGARGPRLRRSIRSIFRPVLKHGPRSLTCARVIGTALNLKA